MKKTFCNYLLMGLFFSCFLNVLSGQQKVRNHKTMGSLTDSLYKNEIGLLFESSFSFQLVYKRQIKKSNYLRLRLLAAYVNKEERFFSNNLKANFRLTTFGFSTGFEKRKALKNHLYFVHGPEGQIYFRLSEREIGNNAIFFTPKLGYILGLHYEISNRVYINAEIFPGISNTWTLSSKERTSNDIYMFTGALSISEARLTLAFKL